MRRLIAAVVALTALAAPATAGAVDIKEFALTALSSPSGIVAGPDGNMWVTENLGQAIDRVNPQTGAATRFPIGDPSAAPLGITAGPDGALWYADEGGPRVGRITTAGALSALQVAGSATRGIAAGPDGALWFTDTGGFVGRIDTLGAVTEYPLSTTAAGASDIVAGSDGALYFTEANVGAIGRITTAGDLTEITVPPGASNPTGITDGPDGALWFTARTGSRLVRMTTTGAFTEFPLPGNGQPTDITTGPDGALWYVDELRDKLGRLTTAGQFTEFDLPGAAQATSITRGPNGTLWYTRGSSTVGRVELLPAPTVGKTVNAEPTSGTVLVRSPKSKRFVKLGADGRQIPTGSQLDTRRGTVSLTAATGAKGDSARPPTSTSDFFDGIFTVTQAKSANAVTEAKLSGPLEGCARSRGTATAAKKTKGRRLWGRGKGRFRTRGRRSSTTVRGTTWLVEDRCDGSTVTTVKVGTVVVKAGKKTVTVKAPNSYVAKR